MAGLAALLPSWLGLLGAWHWSLDLLSHFRWQYLAASVCVAALAGWRRQWALVAVAVLTCALNGLLIGRLAWQAGPPAVAAPDFNLRVVSFNVRTSNLAREAAAQYLQTSDADVILVIEVDAAWLAALQPLAQRYPHRVAQARDDNFGIALFSRVPLESARVLRLAADDTPFIEARFTHQGRRLAVLGAHPIPPVGRDAAASRDGQLARLAARAAAMDVPVLLIGDLNATPWSAGMRKATAGNLGFRSVEPPWAPTWRARSIFAIPIDHALVTAPLVITARAVGPDLGSDHRPLAISLGWQD